MTTVLETITLDQLADLVLAILDFYTTSRPYRTMPEPLLDTLYSAYVALKSDDEAQHKAAYWRLEETLRQCGIEIGEEE